MRKLLFFLVFVNIFIYKLDAQIVVVDDIVCNGDSTGTLMVSPDFGTSPYTYSWNTGDTTSSISNLVAGNYSVTVTDATSATKVYSSTLVDPPQLTINLVSQTNINCNGYATGAIDISVSGGTGSHSFNWSNGAVSEDINNLVAGNYSLVVNDDNNCTVTSSFTITEPATPVEVFINSTNIICNGDSTGTAVANASGGTGTLSYSWNTGDTTSSISNLIAGNYSVIVTDTNACSAASSVVITEPLNPIQLTLVSQNILCAGDSIGFISVVDISGEVGPVTYLWSNGDTLSTIDGLIAGNYSVTVTDANACSAASNLTIVEPSVISVASTITSSSCDGHNDGAVSLAVSGGVGGYSYFWQEINFDSTYTTQNLSNVRGGEYALTITDGNGCNYFDTLTITNNAVVPVNIVTTPYVCNGSTGSVDITAVGAGVSVYYLYEWSSAYTNGSFLTNDSVFTATPSFAAGNYSVTVTAPDGCAMYYDSVVNQSSAPLVVSENVVHNLCYEDSNGSIVLSPSGGDPKPGYHVTWTGPAGFTSTAMTIANLSVGDYTYTIYDDSVCSVTSMIRIEPLNPIQGSIIAQNITCNSYQDGILQAVFSGGTGILNYSWSSGEHTSFVDSLTVGSYYLTITDSAGCVYLDSAMLTEPNAISIIIDSTQDVSCFGYNDGDIWITTSGGVGVLNYTWLHKGLLYSEITEDIINIYAGNYSVNVYDSLGCSATQNFVINQPIETIFLDSIHDVSCNNGSDGYWELTPNGLYNPYVAIFSTGDTISTDTISSFYISGLSSGNYSVVVTDVNGCDYTFETNLDQPLPITIGLEDISNVICKGDSTGSILLDDVHGGTAPYSYVWSDGSTLNPNLNMAAGIYNITIVDSKNCVIYETYEIKEPYERIKYFPDVTATSCRQSEDGQVILYDEDVYASPFNNMFYLYDSLGILVDSVATGEAIFNLAPGNYTTILINEHGCSATDSLYIGSMNEDCILIPNLVTMNADGYNDVFKVQGGCEYDEFFVQIFTDNGVLVFESSECDFVWDPHDNNAVSNSVYYYYISVREDGKLYEFKSSINITK